MLLKLLTIIDPCETNRKISFSGIDGNTGKDIAITKAKLNKGVKGSGVKGSGVKGSGVKGSSEGVKSILLTYSIQSDMV